MPIKPENRARYPKEWKAISTRIRFERADGRCECVGQCGEDHDGRCVARHGQPSPYTGKTVCLTTAHLDHTPENCEDDNLLGMCNRCHLKLDAGHHASNAKATLERKKARILDKAGQLQFETAIFGPRVLG